MGLESGTWVEDLVVTNPPSTDDKRQGDDHLRLIKNVLKNTFKRTSGRPVYFPTSVVTSTNYTILDTDENTIFRCNTSAGTFTLTLPNTLTTANAGWKIIVVKTNSEANPVFIVPPTGTLDGFTKVRRTAENKRTEIMWTGVGWIITRPDSAPIGTTHEYYGATLPNGYLWPDGTTFVAADFAELNSVLGTNTKPDLRGRASFGRDDMGGSTAARITNAGSGIVGTTLKAAGGTEVHTLTSAQIALHTHGLTIVAESSHTHNISGDTEDESSHTHNYGLRGTTTQFSAGGNNIGASTLAPATATTPGSAHHHFIDDLTSDPGTAHSHTGTADNNVGGGGAHQNMPPTIVCNKIIVAE